MFLHYFPQFPLLFSLILVFFTTLYLRTFCYIQFPLPSQKKRNFQTTSLSGIFIPKSNARLIFDQPYPFSKRFHLVHPQIYSLPPPLPPLVTLLNSSQHPPPRPLSPTRFLFNLLSNNLPLSTVHRARFFSFSLPFLLLPLPRSGPFLTINSLFFLPASFLSSPHSSLAAYVFPSHTRVFTLPPSLHPSLYHQSSIPPPSSNVSPSNPPHPYPARERVQGGEGGRERSRCTHRSRWSFLERERERKVEVDGYAKE